MLIIRRVVLNTAAYLILWTAGSADEITLNGKPCNSLCQSWMGVKATDAGGMKPVQGRTISDLNQDMNNKIRRPSPQTMSPPTKQAAVTAKVPAPPMAVEDAHDQAVQPLAPEDRIGPPDPSKIVAARGVIMVQTPEEEALNRKQRADLVKETTKRDPGVGDVDLH